MKTNGLNSSLFITAIIGALFLFAGIGSTTAYGAQAHSVVVGSPDGIIVTSGGDGNFSLIARQDAQGNVSGQWQDAFTRDPGFHMDVTCLTVEGNTAWIGGVITQAANNDWIGLPTVTKCVDNTKDGSGDTISFTFFNPDGPLAACSDKPDLPQFLINAGNVIVK